MESAREARRRRLVERGSDRLAFITGQARTLPTTSNSGHEQGPDPQTATATATATFPSSASPLGGDDASNELSEQQPSKGGIGDKSWSISEILKNEPMDETHQDKDLFPEAKTSSKVYRIQSRDEISKHDSEGEILVQEMTNGASASVQSSRREAEGMTGSMDPIRCDQFAGAIQSMEALKKRLNFSPNQISQAISASENKRLLCSIAIAFLVILFSHGHDNSGAFIRGIISTRPLLLLILANITILYGFLMASKGPDHQEKEKARGTNNNLGSADGIAQILEVGLLLQKAVGALLMDCSICAVIMIIFLGM